MLVMLVLLVVNLALTVKVLGVVRDTGGAFVIPRGKGKKKMTEKKKESLDSIDIKDLVNSTIAQMTAEDAEEAGEEVPEVINEDDIAKIAKMLQAKQ